MSGAKHTNTKCDKSEKREKHCEILKTAVYVAVRAVTAAVLVYSLSRRQWENAGTCVMTLALLMIPSFLERRLKIGLPGVMESLMIFFVFAANILGEISAFYQKLPLLDTSLHAVNGFICAGVGFGLIDILNRSTRVKLSLSPLFVVLFSFCFSMTAGTVWEFFEFAMDSFFGRDMQKDAVVYSIHSHLISGSGGTVTLENIRSTAVNGTDLGIDGYLDIGLIDTMKDLLVNFAGAALFNAAGFFYLIGRKKHTAFIKDFIPKRIAKG